MKNKLLIVGASGHGKVVADIAAKMGEWDTISFIDDNPDKKSILGYKVIDKFGNIRNYINDHDIFVGIGDNLTRKKLLEELYQINASIPTLIHHSAVIGDDVIIESGTVIMAGVVINSSTCIGRGCIINTGVTIDHDNKLGNYVHISPGANLAGAVTIGEHSWLGIGASVSNNISITSNCTIGAGGVVINNIDDPGVYVGVPVRRV